MTETAVEVKPKRISPMHDPAVRAKAAATRARHKEEKEARLAKKEQKEEPEVKQQTAAVKARWAGERASEEDVRKFFAQDLGVEEGLQLLARMRKNCEIASYALNQRITEDSVTKDRCKTCGGPKKPNKQWALVRPHRDPTTQLVANEYFCQIACVALENQKTQGVKGVSDRGMLQSDNPKNHPNA